MVDKQATKRALLLRERAARIVERSLPDQVSRAYGIVPIELTDLPSDDPQLTDLRARARASLLKQGFLTDEELDTLTVDQAIEAARQRVRAQVTTLREQASSLAPQEQGTPDRVMKAPRPRPRR